MSFIAYGSERITPSSSQSPVSKSVLLKRLVSDNTWESYNWGAPTSVQISPVTKSSWLTVDSYDALALTVLNQSFADVFNFNRDMRFRALTDIQSNVVSSTAFNPVFITGAVKGAVSSEAALTTLVSEFLAGEYTNVLAIGTLNEVTSDVHYANDQNTGIKKYDGTLEVIQEYDLPVNDAVYFITAVVAPAAQVSAATSKSYSIYSGDFQQFLANMTIPTQSVGQNEISDLYRPELARSNLMVTVGDDLWITDNTNFILVLTPDILPTLRPEGIYNLNVVMSDSGIDPTVTALPLKLSLGYFDVEEQELVVESELYNIKNRAGTNQTWLNVKNKILTLYFNGTEFIVLQSV